MGQQEGQQHVVDGNGVEQHARDEEDHVDEQEQHDGVVGEGEQHGSAALHESHGAGDPRRRDLAQVDHEHDDGGGLHGFHEHVHKDGELVDGAVDEHAHEQAVEDGHGGGLRWG